ncbi:MAG: acriflavin resistance protein [Bacteroidetes bacterium RIFOXYA12_FULL_35_11]|nr:MAG: acriflavin resistance protein [Bacteroidetes bacterium GWF2_35_48]OFY82457.1 MAG: acriflavin resistance protein [Bacteroidetes bacterium RIFOXYA12_FULL_35_11]HBX51429.1 acriflavin resistance protein [Bacteroidales bacterium]
MSLASVSLKRPVFAIVCSITIVLFGIIGFDFLGVREFPSIDPPVITVRTNYVGANPEIIESQITEPLEKVVNGIAGIRSISSTSSQGMSNITVEFNLGVDLEAAANDVRDKVSIAQRLLPKDLDAPPVVSKADANADAILTLMVQSNTKTNLELTDYASNVLLEQLQTIPGVSSVQIWGEKKYAMRIWFDPVKLVAYQLTLNDVQIAISKQNIELPSGKIYGKSTELSVKTSGKLISEKDFNDLIIKQDKNGVVRLKDIGEAVLGAENEETVMKESGVPMLGLALVPLPGTNYVEIADEFYKRLEKIKLTVPDDINLKIAMDKTVFIRRSLTEVKETLFIAVGLVVLIIFLFFRDWLIAIRPLLDIPVSLIGAFFIMYLAGFTINILTLLGIVLATGLVVDDGIVVTENIFKKIEQGLSRKKAAMEGTQEIFFAVVSTSLTLAVVFLPIIFLQGFTGRLFREFAVTIAGAVLISAFVSLTLTPVLNVFLNRKSKKKSRFYTFTEPFYQSLDTGYREILQVFMKRRKWAFVIIAVCFALIFLIGKNLQSELAPLEDRSLFRVSVTGPEGTSFGYMEQYMGKIAKALNDSIHEKSVIFEIVAPGFTGSGAVNSGILRVGLVQPDERKRSQQEIADATFGMLRKFNAVRAFAAQEPSISAGGGPRMSLPVQYVIQNNNFEKLKEKLPLFADEISKSEVFNAWDVNLKFNRPEAFISIDRLKAADLGVSVLDIAQTLQLALSNSRIDYFMMNGKQYQVIGQVIEEDRGKPIDLTKFYVRSVTGDLVQLDNVISITEQSNPPQLYHYNRYKSATVSAGLNQGKTLGDGIKEMQKISKKVLDDSFSTDLTGQARDFAESSSSTLFALVLALVLIYLILAVQFESFLDPFIIMATVPLAFAGAILALWMFNQTLNIFSEIGIIMLIGLVTKNGILIVEFANKRRLKGEEKIVAVVEAAALRLRPILMTSFATALGALPIALALGAGAQSRVSLGIVVIGGILFSLILTLFVIPAMYVFISRKKQQIDEE